MQQLLAQSTHSAERFARMRQAALLLGGAVTLQVSLGISTLLLHVPVSLATAHQAGSLALLTSALYLLFTTRNPAARKHAQRMLELYAKKMASATPKKL
jgi:heme A synthase